MNAARILALGIVLSPSLGMAQSPSPAQVGITTATPNVVQVYDSSHNWATIGTVDPTTHVFTVSGAAGIPEAPTGSGVLYGRKNSVWSTVAHTDITDWTATLTPYALLASPAFTGTPSLPTGTTGITQTAGDNSTKLATTAFVGAAVTAGGGGTITAGTTPTSGFTAGQVLYSDGSKVQPIAGQFTQWAPNPSYPVYIGAYSSFPSVLNFTANNASPGNYGFGIAVYSGQTSADLSIYDTDLSGAYGFLFRTGLAAGLPEIAFMADATNIAEFRSAAFPANPVALRVNNTHIDASNGEWGAFDWLTVANTLTIGAQANGTGTVRPVNIVGSTININGAAPNTNGGIDTSTTSSVVVGAIETGGGSGVAGVGLADVATGSYLRSGGVTTIPAWQAFGTGAQTAVNTAINTTGGLVTQSGTLAASALLLGGGSAAAITSTTTGTGVVTALGVNTGSTGAMVLQTAPGVTQAGFVSNGTQPTITGSGGTCATTTKVGGATAGTVVLSAVCASTNTIAWTGLPTAPNGWACDAVDRTTRTAGPFIESASTTTGFTLTVGSTSSVAADVLQWKCQGY